MTGEIISDEFAAGIQQSLGCDCDHNNQIEGMPHREWCTRNTPLGVIKDIARLAIGKYSSQRGFTGLLRADSGATP